MSDLTIEQICEQVTTCCGNPTDEFFRKGVIKLLCAIQTGLSGLETTTAVDVEVVRRCDLVDDVYTPFLKVFRFLVDGDLEVARLDYTGATYTLSGTEVECPQEVVEEGEEPAPAFSAMVATLCDVQESETVRFLRFYISDGTETTSHYDTELDGETAYNATGEVTDCPISIALEYSGNVYAGETCWSQSGSIRKAIRFVNVEDGVVTDQFSFFDSITGDAVDPGDLMECAAPGCCFDAALNLDVWGHDSCLKSERLFDVGSLLDKISNECYATNYRISFEVEGIEIHTDKLLGFNHTQGLAVVVDLEDQSAEAEEVDGAPQILINALNKLTAPYIEWKLWEEGSEPQISFTYSIYSAFVLTVERELPGCAGTSDDANQTYTLTKTAGNAPVWTDTETTTFNALWGAC